MEYKNVGNVVQEARKDGRIICTCYGPNAVDKAFTIASMLCGYSACQHTDKEPEDWRAAEDEWDERQYTDAHSPDDEWPQDAVVSLPEPLLPKGNPFTDIEEE